MKIDGSLARNIDFEVANFEVHEKTRRKTSILKLQSMKIGGSLARNARLEAPTCLVSILWFSSSVAVSMGETAFKPFIFECFAWQAWHFVIFVRLSRVCKRVKSRFVYRGNTSVSFSDDELHFSWQAQHWRPPSSFCVAGAAL